MTIISASIWFFFVFNYGSYANYVQQVGPFPDQATCEMIRKEAYEHRSQSAVSARCVALPENK